MPESKEEYLWLTMAGSTLSDSTRAAASRPLAKASIAPAGRQAGRESEGDRQAGRQVVGGREVGKTMEGGSCQRSGRRYVPMCAMNMSSTSHDSRRTLHCPPRPSVHQSRTPRGPHINDKHLERQ